MHRFFVPSVSCSEEFSLNQDDAKKISRVLKLGPGDEIFLWDESGKEYLAQITRMNQHSVYVRVVDERFPEVESLLRVILVQGIPKGDKMEFVIQKTTELGVWGILPVITERTVVQLSEERRKTRLKRWQVIAKEAARQSGRVHIPEIGEITSLPEVWEQLDPGAIKLICWEGKATGLKSYFQTAVPSFQHPVYLFIGPEGGFSSSEVEYGVARGGIPVSLGPRILRTETAGIVGLSLLLYEWGDLGGGCSG